ncbi:hypothetical protein OAB01_02660 [Bacteroidia bacterium]|nr:hypothetical protein [Bacteroidia bacterium]
MVRLLLLFILVLCLACRGSDKSTNIKVGKETGNALYEPLILAQPVLASRFNSLDDFKSKVQVKYYNYNGCMGSNSMVQLKLKNKKSETKCELKSGLSQAVIIKAKNGGLLDKVKLTLRSPHTIRIRNNLKNVFLLARREAGIFGYRDVAFYDLALALSQHINKTERAYKNTKDSGEKGYINTFNHIAAQAIITSFFSKELASFVADVHERKNMPELTTGKFTPEQLQDTSNYPEDNYVDIINNAIGQELGLVLQKKHQLDEVKQCTPELFANYLNDLQSYLSWSMGIELEPFHSNDEVVVRFAHKLNHVLKKRF